jgi:hypothetical protein
MMRGAGSLEPRGGREGERTGGGPTVDPGGPADYGPTGKREGKGEGRATAWERERERETD